VINLTTRTTIVSNVQLDDNIRIWLLEQEEFKSAPETWKCWRRNNVFGQSIPDSRSRNVEGPTNDCRQSEHCTTRRLELAERSARRQCRSANRSSGPRYLRLDTKAFSQIKRKAVSWSSGISVIWKHVKVMKLEVPTYRLCRVAISAQPTRLWYWLSVHQRCREKKMRRRSPHPLS